MSRPFSLYGLQGIDTSPTAKTEQRCLCPECESSRTHKGHKDCSVNIDNGRWHCHHCNASGYVPTHDEIKQRTGRERRIERLRNAPPDVGKYSRPTWVPEYLVGNLLHPSAQQQQVIDYLTQQRRLSTEVLQRARVTIPYVDRWIDDPGGQRQPDGKPLRIRQTTCAMAFNYFDHGVLINQKLRFLDKSFVQHKGAEQIPFNIDAILRKEVCYITEGEIDALTLLEAGFPEAISVPNGGSNTNLTWLDRFVETHFLDKRLIYLALDLDPVGLNMMRELVRRLGSAKCRIVVWPTGCKDANEVLCRHGPDQLRRCIEQAATLPLYGIQTACTPEVERDLDDMFRNGVGNGAAIGLHNVDQQITFETGRFMVVTGRPGDGKSEFVDELALRLCLRHQWRVAYFSPENVPLKYHLAKLVAKLTGYEFRKGGRMSDELYQACKHWLDQNVCHIMPGSDYDNDIDPVLTFNTEVDIEKALRPDVGEAESFTLDEVLAVAREAVQRRGVRICVFDPLNSFRRSDTQAGMSDLQWYLHVCNTMLGFAHRNDVLVVLVAHPRKVDRSMLDNKKRRVEMNDISGSSDFANKSDFCISVDRDDDLKVVTLYVDKVKFKHLGSRGQVNLHYDILSGRYLPCTIQRLSEQDYILLRNQPRKSGEQLIELPSGHYLKTVDFRWFNTRWVDASTVD